MNSNTVVIYATFTQESSFRDYFVKARAKTKEEAIERIKKDFNSISNFYDEKYFKDNKCFEYYPKGLLCILHENFTNGNKLVTIVG
jgi:hypothetical protein